MHNGKSVNIKTNSKCGLELKMKYACIKCDQTFHDKTDADAHENESGHRVELQTGSTYWGAHLVTV